MVEEHFGKHYMIGLKQIEILLAHFCRRFIFFLWKSADGILGFVLDLDLYNDNCDDGLKEMQISNITTALYIK